MENVFRNFYRNFYNKTQGFIPTKPLTQNVYPGDFFQIKNGEFIVLGNIFRKNVLNADDIVFENGIKLNSASWNFSDGVKKAYSGRDAGHNAIEGDFEFSRQVLDFDKSGSFFFSSSNPESVKIANWGDFKNELIIKMTQIMYSFRKLYIVTECATTENWTLAIAGSKKGELEIATESENFGLVNIFGDANAKTIRAKDIEFYHREEQRKPSFFKAKKLVAQQEKLEIFINELISDRTRIASWANNFFQYDFYHNELSYNPPITTNAQTSLLDMLQANQLNPNTALQYFSWADANLDDIELLFNYYGD
ncbi:hypothetical protein C8N46_101673 [Kordia periserrulae]|uniref:Uncharacterized protein n=1 Tax=Kordia periserrulae TaxID=701523 RepID=A0A2T6C6Z4_9FLAO|nr:hypothetical protein [Kordia periserrulae]PTX64063.1 hypothetical protein C8N46_101673 [Kordia periserrulae]